MDQNHFLTIAVLYFATLLFVVGPTLDKDISVAIETSRSYNHATTRRINPTEVHNSDVLSACETIY